MKLPSKEVSVLPGLADRGWQEGVDARLVARVLRLARPGLIGMELAQRILAGVQSMSGRLPLLSRFPQLSRGSAKEEALPVVHVRWPGADAPFTEPSAFTSEKPPVPACAVLGRVVERERLTERTLVERERSPGEALPAFSMSLAAAVPPESTPFVSRLPSDLASVLPPLDTLAARPPGPIADVSTPRALPHLESPSARRPRLGPFASRPVPANGPAASRMTSTSGAIGATDAGRALPARFLRGTSTPQELVVSPLPSGGAALTPLVVVRPPRVESALRGEPALRVESLRVESALRVEPAQRSAPSPLIVAERLMSAATGNPPAALRVQPNRARLALPDLPLTLPVPAAAAATASVAGVAPAAAGARPVPAPTDGPSTVAIRRTPITPPVSAQPPVDLQQLAQRVQGILEQQAQHARSRRGLAR